MSSRGGGDGGGGGGAAAGGSGGEIQHQVIFKGKLIVVGDTNVGKTSIVERLTENKFSLNQKTSVAVAYSTKQVTVDSHTTVKFDIWDTAGQERFRSISALFYRGSAAAIIVYDITDRKSFDTARNYWLTQLRTHAVKDCIIVFAGNKGDQEERRVVRAEEATALCEEHGYLHFETSAKTGANVQEMFTAIGAEVPSHLDGAGFKVIKVERSPTTGGGGGVGGGDRDAEPKKCGC